MTKKPKRSAADKVVLGQLGCGNYRPVFEPVVEITSLDWRSKWISLEPVVEGPFTEADPVRLIYLDESGLGEERFLVVAGVIVEADSQYMAVARHLRALIAEVVPPEKRHGFAFEAKKLFSGKKPFDKHSLSKRIEILSQILQIPGLFELPVVYGYLDKHAPVKGLTEEQLRETDSLANKHGVTFTMCAMAAEQYMKKYARKEEVATLHAEDNRETHQMLRVARKSLAGGSKYDIRRLLGPKAVEVLPTTRIVDGISFHEKDDAFLIQLADACAFLLRVAFEGRKDCAVFYDAFTGGHPDVLKGLAERTAIHPLAGNIIQFHEIIA
jgi:hypothetical protein